MFPGGSRMIHISPFGGRPNPSPEDVEDTQRLVEAGSDMGVDLIDHVIFGDHRFISLKEKGYL